MTNGYWLDHAPESFLVHEIARSVARTGHMIFTEISEWKVRVQNGTGSRRGRPREDRQRRFDIGIWLKSGDRLRAIIEVKRYWSDLGSINKDAKKIRRFLTHRKFPTTGYLLIYAVRAGKTKHERREKLKTAIDDLRNATSRMGWRVMKESITIPRIEAESDSGNGKEWGWSVCLIRRRFT